MKKLFILITLFPLFLSAQDTVSVQTLTYDSTGRNYFFDFPIDDGTTYEKVLMLYSMRCKDALVSTPSDRNKGCGEWDYSCNTYIRDTSFQDSVKATHPSHIISGFDGSTYTYTTSPLNDYYTYTYKDVNVSTIISEDTFTIGTTTMPDSTTFGTAKSTRKTQYLWRASELTNAGLSAGSIAGMLFDITSIGSLVSNLRIKLKHTSQNSLNPSNPHNTGFTQVFYNTRDFISGINDLRFYNNFNWNGTSNLIVEISYTNNNDDVSTVLNSHDAGFNSTLTSSNDFSFLFTGGEFIDLGGSGLNNISDEITISFWSYGDDNSVGSNTSICEGLDNAGNRQVNIHFPWSNNRIYWDCGNNGGYDRIDELATASEIAGSWKYWSFVKNTNTGDMKIYLNGTLWHSGTLKTKLIDLVNLKLGTNYSNAYDYFGKVDDFSVWSSELSPTEINDWMYKKIDNTHPKFSDLVGFYNMNEGEGSSIIDISPNAETGLISGFAKWIATPGNNIFKDFEVSTKRPNVSFLKGSYTLAVTDDIVYDTIQSNPDQVVSYQSNGSEITPFDTILVWGKNYEYMYNAFGVKVDSFAVSNPNSITITGLDYFIKSPMDFEIMSFVTPYGIYLDLGVEGKTWTFDVSDFEPILHGNKQVFLSRGGQNQEEMDIKFLFIKGTPTREVKDIKQIWKVNQRAYSGISTDQFFYPVNVNLDPTADAFKIRTAVTGHGQEGEFVPRTHYLNINGGSKELEWEVWTECANNPVYPQGGTWIFDRAGWCPGAPTDVKDYYIDAGTQGYNNVEIDYGVNFAGGDSRYIVNSQLVTYGAPNFTLDAEILDIIRPSKKVEFQRLNPACEEPIVVIRNNGSSNLTSLNITYNVDQGNSQSITWTGNLDYLETDTVILPILDENFWLSPTGKNIFTATINNPNGGVDGYDNNNSLESEFDKVDVYTNTVKVSILTNGMPYENSYLLTNLSGDTILFGEQYELDANTDYNEELTLNQGCYSFYLADDMVGNYGQNGLEFWYYSQFGAGAITFRDSLNNVYLDPDFGAFTRYDFAVGDIYNTETLNLPKGVDYQLFNVFPNPVMDIIYINLHGYQTSTTIVEIISSKGEIVHSSTLSNISNKHLEEINISNLDKGIYLLKVQQGNTIRTKKIVKQ